MSALNAQETKKKRGRPSAPKLVEQNRFRKLVDDESDRGISRQEIADAIGCDVSTITKHYNEDSPIDLKFLYEYAKYFNVSTDYLLGLSEVSSTNPDDKAICEKIGCSERAYESLKLIYQSPIGEMYHPIESSKELFDSFLYCIASPLWREKGFNNDFIKSISKKSKNNYELINLINPGQNWLYDLLNAIDHLIKCKKSEELCNSITSTIESELEVDADEESDIEEASQKSKLDAELAEYRLIRSTSLYMLKMCCAQYIQEEKDNAEEK